MEARPDDRAPVDAPKSLRGPKSRTGLALRPPRTLVVGLGKPGHCLAVYPAPLVLDPRSGSCCEGEKVPSSTNTLPVGAPALRGETELGRCRNLCALAEKGKSSILSILYTHSLSLSRCKAAPLFFVLNRILLETSTHTPRIRAPPPARTGEGARMDGLGPRGDVKTRDGRVRYAGPGQA